MEEKKSFGKFIREKRNERGYSQLELADILFVSESAVSKWERGVNYPDVTMISDICKALDISEHELITASNDTEYRELKRDAGKFRLLSKVSLISCLAVYGTTLAICLICNLVMSHTLSWFWVVFGSLICAFSFFPTYSRFFKKDKLLYFLLTSFASIAVLLVICGLFTGSVSWVPVSCASVFLLYSLVFLPVLMKQYNMPEIIDKAKFLIYVLAAMVLTLLVILTAAVLTNIPVGDSILIALYGFMPFVIMGILFIFVKKKLIRAGISVLLIYGGVYGVNKFADSLIGNGSSGGYVVDFSNWADCANGNIMLIMAIVAVIVGGVLIGVGCVRKKDAK